MAFKVLGLETGLILLIVRVNHQDTKLDWLDEHLLLLNLWLRLIINDPDDSMLEVDRVLAMLLFHLDKGIVVIIVEHRDHTRLGNETRLETSLVLLRRQHLVL